MELKTKGKRILTENDGAVDNRAKLWKPSRNKIHGVRQTFEGEELRRELRPAYILTAKHRIGGKLTSLVVKSPFALKTPD
jgi:hypothetical protein